MKNAFGLNILQDQLIFVILIKSSHDKCQLIWLICQNCFPKGDGQFPALYRKSDKGVQLDSNHTHFVLVDNGTVNFGAEIVLRTAMEKYVTTLNISSDPTDQGERWVC